MLALPIVLPYGAKTIPENKQQCLFFSFRFSFLSRDWWKIFQLKSTVVDQYEQQNVTDRYDTWINRFQQLFHIYGHFQKGILLSNSCAMLFHPVLHLCTYDCVSLCSISIYINCFVLPCCWMHPKSRAFILSDNFPHSLYLCFIYMLHNPIKQHH